MTDYELSEQHMKAVFVTREPLSLAGIRGEHWDAFTRKVQADAFAEGVNHQWKHRPLGNRSPYNPYL